MKEYRYYVEYSIVKVDDGIIEDEGQFFETREEAEAELQIYRNQFPNDNWEIEEHHGTTILEHNV